MTPAAYRNDGLQWFGHEDATTAPAFLLTNIATELTGALETIYTRGPQWMRQANVSLPVKAARTLAGKSLAKYAVQFDADTGDAVTADMVGCSCEISGDNRWLTLESADALGVGATTRDPWMGESVIGATVTVYGDAIPLSAQYGIQQPVYLHPVIDGRFQQARLYPLNDRKELQETVYGWRHNTVDQPKWYMTEWHNNALFLRLFPWPDADYAVYFQAEVNPVKYAAADLGNDADDVPVPSGMDATVLLPIFRYRLSKYPHFNNDEAIPRLKEEHDDALRQLEAMDPQKEKDLRVLPAFCG